MGKINRGIIGHVIGSLSSVTCYVRRKKGIIQKRIVKSSKKRTIAQVNQGLKFKVVGQTGSTLYHSVIKESFNIPNKNTNTYNAFVRKNKDAINLDGSPDTNNFAASIGNQAYHVLQSSSWIPSENAFRLTWFAEPTPYSNTVPLFPKALIYNRRLNKWYPFMNEPISFGRSVRLQIPVDWLKFDALDSYLWFSDNESDNSNSFSQYILAYKPF